MRDFPFGLDRGHTHLLNISLDLGDYRDKVIILRYPITIFYLPDVAIQHKSSRCQNVRKYPDTSWNPQAISRPKTLRYVCTDQTNRTTQQNWDITKLKKLSWGFKLMQISSRYQDVRCQDNLWYVWPTAVLEHFPTSPRSWFLKIWPRRRKRLFKFDE